MLAAGFDSHTDWGFPTVDRAVQAIRHILSYLAEYGTHYQEGAAGEAEAAVKRLASLAKIKLEPLLNLAMNATSEFASFIQLANRCKTL
jgi:hypothetical protein